MKNKDWLRYGIKGFIIGIVHHIILLIVQYSNLKFITVFYEIEFYIICKTLNLGAGEPCGWTILFWIPIIFTLIGVLIGIARMYWR